MRVCMIVLIAVLSTASVFSQVFETAEKGTETYFKNDTVITSNEINYHRFIEVKNDSIYIESNDSIEKFTILLVEYLEESSKFNSQIKYTVSKKDKIYYISFIEDKNRKYYFSVDYINRVIVTRVY